MSLDIYLKCPECEHNVEHFNLTYNLAPMCRKLFPKDECMLQSIEGRTGAETISLLQASTIELCSNRSQFEALEPSNGWGSYDGLSEVLMKMFKAACENPKAVWVMSR